MHKQHAAPYTLKYIYLFVVECTTLVLHETPFVVQSSEGLPKVRLSLSKHAEALETLEERKKSFATPTGGPNGAGE